MSQASLDPIPIPRRLLWREARLRFLPPAVFLAVVVTIAILWRGHVGSPTLTGQAEPILATVSSHRAGTLVELRVARFQLVHAGEILGRVTVADAAIAASKLEVIRAEIEQIRAEMRPVLRHDKNLTDIANLRLDYMRQRAELGTQEANLQLAEAEFTRVEILFREKIVPESLMDYARAFRDGTKKKVDELKRLVSECEQSLASVDPTNSISFAAASGNPLHAAIVAQETKLRLAEIELSPVELRAPMDGIVNAVLHQPGETVNIGLPIVTIATANSARIVGYVRAPLAHEPRVGMVVKVTTRGPHRATGVSRITEVGTQLEAIPPVLHPSLKLASSDLGLPVDIAVPAGLKIRPGEIVDITMLPETD